MTTKAAEVLRLPAISGEAARLWTECFGDDPEYVAMTLRERLADSACFGIRDEKGALVSMAYAKPELMRLGGEEAPAAFIVGVCTRKSARGRGCASAIIARAAETAKAAGARLIYLATEIPAFYERLGFTVQGELREYGVLPKADARLTVRSFSPETADLPALLGCYNRYIADKNGPFARAADDMRWRVREAGGGVAAYGENGLCAYALDDGEHYTETVYFDIAELRALSAFRDGERRFILPRPEADESVSREGGATALMLLRGERISGFCNFDSY